MAIEIQAPKSIPREHFSKFKVFMGGTIDMGSAVNWQKSLVQDLIGEDLVLLNPRRDDFRVWEKQEASNSYFKEQVMWELSHQDEADLCIYYLAPNSQSRITLLEIGLFAPTKEHIICCSPDFDRKGNIDITAQYYHLNVVDTYEQLLSGIMAKKAVYDLRKN